MGIEKAVTTSISSILCDMKRGPLRTEPVFLIFSKDPVTEKVRAFTAEAHNKLYCDKYHQIYLVTYERIGDAWHQHGVPVWDGFKLTNAVGVVE